MQISYYNQNNNTFTGFRFTPASKERFYRILEGINDPNVTNKCRSIIEGQKRNPVDIEIRNLNIICGQKIDDGLNAYINGKLSHDNTGMNDFGFIYIREVFDEKYNIIRFLFKAAKKSRKSI